MIAETPRATARPRGGPLRWAAAAALVATPLLAGCGTGASGQPGGATAPSVQLSTQAQASDPGQVAVSYVRALYTGKFDTARSYILPASQGVFLAVTQGMQQSRAVVSNLAVGSTNIAGDESLVILKGKFCAAGPSASPGDCISNTQADNPNPAFRVNLVRDNGKWLVTYREPQQGSGGTSASASTSATG